MIDLRMIASLPALLACRGRLLCLFARTGSGFRHRAFALVSRARTFAEDHDDRLLAARARTVVMHFFSRMGNEGAGLDRNGSFLRIPNRAGVRPPRARDHHDVAIIGVIMRMTEI